MKPVKIKKLCETTSFCTKADDQRSIAGGFHSWFTRMVTTETDRGESELTLSYCANVCALLPYCL